MFVTEELQNLTISSRLKEGFHRKEDTKDIWSPNIKTVFKALASARLCAAVWNNITDCDETYNYWEPVSLFLKKIRKKLHFISFPLTVTSFIVWLWVSNMGILPSFCLTVIPFSSFICLASMDLWSNFPL